MKKLISLMLSIVILLTMCIVTSAASNTKNDTIINFDDGSYIIIEISEYVSTRATNTKTGQKSYTYYDSDDVIQWKATLTATFTYTGTSSTCTNANITYNVYDSNWKITEATSSKSENKATGKVTAKTYFLGIPTKTIEHTLNITCSASGTLS